MGYGSILFRKNARKMNGAKKYTGDGNPRVWIITYLTSMRIIVSVAVAEWLERRLLNLQFTGSNTGGATA